MATLIASKTMRSTKKIEKTKPFKDQNIISQFLKYKNNEEKSSLNPNQNELLRNEF